MADSRQLVHRHSEGLAVHGPNAGRKLCLRKLIILFGRSGCVALLKRV